MEHPGREACAWAVRGPGRLQMQGRRLCACRGQQRWTACRDGGARPAGRQDVRRMDRPQYVRLGAGSWLSDRDVEGYLGASRAHPLGRGKLAGAQREGGSGSCARC